MLMANLFNALNLCFTLQLTLTKVGRAFSVLPQDHARIVHYVLMVTLKDLCPLHVLIIQSQVFDVIAMSEPKPVRVRCSY